MQHKSKKNKTESPCCEIKAESPCCEVKTESSCRESKIERSCLEPADKEPETADKKPSLLSVLRDAAKSKKSKMGSSSETADKEALLASSTLSRNEAATSSSDAIDKEISEAWNIYMQWKKEPSSENPKIPRFYFKVPCKEGSLRQKLREEARAVFIERKNRELLDNEDLRHLWVLLEKNKTPPFTSDEHKINYQDYMKVANKLDNKFRPYFSARIFAKLLQSDPYGRISVRHFFNYVMRKVWLHQTRIGLSLYDVAGQGYLREVDLENYILELIPTLPQLDGLEASFHSFYVCTAVRKFFFFLDPLRWNKVRILDILACSFLDDLLELRDETLPKDVQDSNWFSAPSALRVYGQYLNLDTDHNGMLSKQELARYGTALLTPVFIERVFQECLTYDREMDYKTYLDFVLALENRKEPQSLQYFFRLLDIRQRNYLTVFEFNYFFRAIQDQLKAMDQELVLFEDVKDEIFDMIKPADPLRVTLNDLILCGQGDTVVSILIDLNGFWTYENREVFVADNNEEAEV